MSDFYNKTYFKSEEVWTKCVGKECIVTLPDSTLRKCLSTSTSTSTSTSLHLTYNIIVLYCRAHFHHRKTCFFEFRFFVYCHCCTSFNVRIVYSFRFTTTGLHFVPTSVELLLRECRTCSSQTVRSAQVYRSWLTASPDTADTCHSPGIWLKSVFHFLWQCICEQEGTCIVWWKCSTDCRGI
jgi:hypothetical protein